jgi:hypothetical protein
MPEFNNKHPARRVIDIIAPVCKKHLESQNISIVNDPSIGAALARGNFLFVSLSNGSEKSCSYGDKIFCLNREDTDKFLMGLPRKYCTSVKWDK